MRGFARNDTSVLGRWWWTVDRWTLAALVGLMGLGAVLIMAVAPAAAERIGGLGTFQRGVGICDVFLGIHISRGRLFGDQRWVGQQRVGPPEPTRSVRATLRTVRATLRATRSVRATL